MSQPVNVDSIDFFEIDQDITLRRMVLRNSNLKGTVLLLQGFPETLYAWKDIAKALADDYEIHAFDRPRYGLSSRRTDQIRGQVSSDPGQTSRPVAAMPR